MTKLFYAWLALLGLGLVATASPAQAQLFSANGCGSGFCGGMRIASPPPYYGPSTYPRRPFYPGRRHAAGRGYCAPLGSPQWLASNPRPPGPGWHMVERVPGKPCGGWHRGGYAGSGYGGGGYRTGGYGVAAATGYGGGVNSGELKCPALGSDKFYELNPKPDGDGWEMVENVPGKPCGGWHRVVAR